jgi:alpha-amylase/alpha-mannosidase (GH57 family)
MVKLALLWHMHQPFYEDLATGEHILPWVRLHALKDYWGMVALLREFPAIRATFNLVPSLLIQLEAFAAERAQDRHLLIGLKPAEALEDSERDFLVANGFHAQFDRMVRPYPRYAALHAKRVRREPFSTADLRDLQVLHKLVWMDPDALRTDPRLIELSSKGQAYTEADKQTLREVELELLRAVIPAYGQAAATARIELSTSPFYHPILPLLCDTDVHRRTHPESPLPRRLFSSPDDARLQLRRAFEYHASLFGRAAAGVWPSEGSLSDEVVALLAEARCAWTATDEEILRRSLQRPVTAVDLYRPYVLGSGDATVRALFRDHRLSDLIGFAYQSWSAAAAAADFVNKVRDAGRRFRQEGGQGAAVVTVILDGENAWEHYPGGGRPFLRALYSGLQEAADIQTVTMSEAAAGPAQTLPSVFPGSWINGDFYIWAGHRDDHCAWGHLAAARKTYDAAADAAGPENAARALEELLIAEGSDWFWWYGDDHSSNHDRDFDDLFRRHLRNVYRALGLTAPDDLHLTNITTSPATGAPVTFRRLSRPEVDGHGDFLGWAAATDVALGEGGGTMHRAAGLLVQRLVIAASRQTLYLRLDGAELARRVSAGQVALTTLVDHPHHVRLSITDGAPARVGPGPGAVTVAVPFAALQAQAADRLSVSVLITDPSGHVLEQHPGQQPLELMVPTRHHDAIHWVV